jgi:hypothetical protein
MMFDFDTAVVQERASAGVCGEFVKFAFSCCLSANRAFDVRETGVD